jgi:drug/metabolite transporter (DMT)-like permease
MIGIILALLAAMAYALSTVLARRGLSESDIMSSILVITAIGIIVFFPLTLIFADLRAASIEAILYFTLAGVLAPGLFTLFFFRIIKEVGVSVSGSVFAVIPIFGSLFGVFLLNEVLFLQNWIGIICIAIGVAVIGRSIRNPKTAHKNSLKKSLIYPLLAGLILASSVVIRKHALSIYNEPLVGVSLGLSISFLLYLPIFFSIYYSKGSLSLKKNFRLFWKSGVWGAFAEIAAFFALSFELVSIVTPLLQTESLFILLFAHLFLKEIERLSLKLVVSTLLVVVGAILVSLR